MPTRTTRRRSAAATRLRTLARARAACTARSASSRPLLGPLGGRSAARRAARQRGRRRHRRLPVRRPSTRRRPRRLRSPPSSTASNSASHDDQARPRCRQRRGAGDDRAWREGPRSADRDPDRRLRRARTRSAADSRAARRHERRAPGLVAGAGTTIRDAMREAREPLLPRARHRGAQPPPLRGDDPGQGPAGDRAVIARQAGRRPQRPGARWCAAASARRPAASQSRDAPLRRRSMSGATATRRRTPLRAGAGRSGAGPSTCRLGLRRRRRRKPEPLPPFGPPAPFGAARPGRRAGDRRLAPRRACAAPSSTPCSRRLPACPPTGGERRPRLTSGRARRSSARRSASVIVANAIGVLGHRGARSRSSGRARGPRRRSPERS